MTGQDMMPSTARAARMVRLFRRAGGILAAVVGLIALIVGVTFLASQTWPAATGTVESCTTSVSGTRSGSTHQTCTVTWMDGGQPRTASVDLGNGSHFAGDPVDLRVHGDTAVVATPAWLGYAAAVFGLILLAGGAFVAVRKPRSASA